MMPTFVTSRLGRCRRLFNIDVGINSGQIGFIISSVLNSTTLLFPLTTIISCRTNAQIRDSQWWKFCGSHSIALRHSLGLILDPYWFETLTKGLSWWGYYGTNAVIPAMAIADSRKSITAVQCPCFKTGYLTTTSSFFGMGPELCQRCDALRSRPLT